MQSENHVIRSGRTCTFRLRVLKFSRSSGVSKITAWLAVEFVDRNHLQLYDNVQLGCSRVLHAWLQDSESTRQSRRATPIVESSNALNCRLISRGIELSRVRTSQWVGRWVWPVWGMGQLQYQNICPDQISTAHCFMVEAH